MTTKIKKGICYMAGIFLPGISIGGCYPFIPAYIASASKLSLDKRIVSLCSCIGIILFLPVTVAVKYLLFVGVSMILLALLMKVEQACSLFWTALICAVSVSGIGIGGELLFAESDKVIVRTILEGVFTMTVTFPAAVWMNRFLKEKKKEERVGYEMPQQEQMNQYARSFLQLSKILGQKLERRPYPYTWEREEMKREVVQAVCGRCDLCPACTLGETGRLDSFLFPLLLPGKELDLQEEEQRIYFKQNCPKSGRMEEEVLHIFERAKLNLSWYNRLLENREMIAEQLNVMAELMEGYTRDYKDITVRYAKKIADVELSLKSMGVTMEECRIYERKNRHWQVVLTVRTTTDRSVRMKDICEAVENGLERELQQFVGTRVFLTRESVKLILEDVPRFYLMQGIAKRTKAGEEISGDNFSVLTVEEGRAAICLSDGMGSGQEAFSESTTVVEMMEAFLQAGLEPEMAIHMMNSAMVLSSKDDMFSTLDLCVGDLHSGNFRFYKVGAAPSFLKHNQYVECVSAVGVPAGTFYKIEVAEKRKKLSSGEYIIMMTDGLLDFLPVEDPVAWMQDCVGKISATKPATMAEAILEQVLSCIGGVPKDDMTVCVCGLWENE